jgi:RHS repeat-associated protein
MCDTSPAGLFSTPAFTATASGTTFSGGGATINDTGNVTVTLTDATTGTAVTTAAVPWTSASTSTTLASALKTAITNAASSTVTATTDDTGMSISLKSALSGAASDNYNVAINVTDTTAANNPKYSPASLPTSGFQFDASSLTGAGNGAPVTNYGMIYSYLIPAGGYAANSNIISHSDSVMGDWAFQYDTLNRLTVAAPALNAPTSYQKSVGCFNYDGFGNRTLAAFTTSSDCTKDTTATAIYDVNNHMTSVSQSAPIQSSGSITVDAAGNVIADPLNKYLYDGEGRLCAVETILTGAATQYSYDASGGRVAKWKMSTWPGSGVCPLPSTSGATLTNEYLLDQGGDQVTELNTSSGTMAWAHSNVWAGSHLDATYDAKGLHFHLADPLGTRRIQTNIDGAVEETCQSLPFGDNLSCATTALATADDATEHHFTGKERDSESGNDYFGARYYASSMGRWMSPDPLGWIDWQHGDDEDRDRFAAYISNPQHFNMYAYVLNNPLSFTDPDGEAELNQKQVVAIIKQAQASTDNPGKIAGAILKGLPSDASVSGKTLTAAFKETGVKLDGAVGTLLSKADSITKSGDNVSIKTTSETMVPSGKDTLKVATTVSFNIGNDKGDVTLNNIKGITITSRVSSPGLSKVQIGKDGVTAWAGHGFLQISVFTPYENGGTK